MNSTENKLVYIVEDEDGSRRRNWGTGTKIYTRKANAEALLRKAGGSCKVVTYKLVKVEEEYDKQCS